MARPAKQQSTPSEYERGYIDGLVHIREQLTLANKLGQATLRHARAAVELAIVTERAERGFEPESLELLDRIAALTAPLKHPPPIEDDADGDEPESAPAPAPRRRPQPQAPAPAIAAAFEPRPRGADLSKPAPESAPEDSDDEWSADE